MLQPPTQDHEAICGVRFLQQPHVVQQRMVLVRIIAWRMPYLSQMNQRDSNPYKSIGLAGRMNFLLRNI